MSIVHNTLASLVSVVDGIDPANRLLALVQTRDALTQIIDRAQGQKPKKARKLTVKHQSLLETPAPAAKAPEVEPFKAVIRNGLIVVTFTGGRDGYLRHKQILGDNVFGFSGKDKEWRASEKWVRANKPEILKGLKLA
jgi:hypothetical protein